MRAVTQKQRRHGSHDVHLRSVKTIQYQPPSGGPESCLIRHQTAGRDKLESERVVRASVCEVNVRFMR